MKATEGAIIFGLLLSTSGAYADPQRILPKNYSSSDSRSFWGDGDWDPGALKAECGYAGILIGVAGTQAGNGINGNVAGCWDQSSPTHRRAWEVYSIPETHSLSNGDDRGDTSTGDWDVGFAKAECAFESVVAGVSQVVGSRTISKILCRSTCGLSQTMTSDCNVLQYVGNDNRLSFLGGPYDNTDDWAVGYHKNQCRDDQVIKGISKNNDGSIHALLCCDVGPSACTPPQR